MRILKHPSRTRPTSKPILLTTLAISLITFIYFYSTLISNNGLETSRITSSHLNTNDKKFLYWGNRIDCPGKHCHTCAGLGHQESSLRCALEEAIFLQRIDCPGKHCHTCAGLGHQESSLRCALEEAIFLQRTFVMPSRMCINPIHNNKGIMHHSENVTSEEMWAASSCTMDSLYDLDLISSKVPVVLDNSKTWFQVMSTRMKLGSRGIAHVEGVSRANLKERSQYSKVLLINRTASHLSWFMECKDRNNRSSVLLPHSFLPSMAAKKLRDAAEKIMTLLGDYDAIHVRRGDILNTRKDRFGVVRTLHPHLDRDTRPRFILCRIEKWVQQGRMIFIASNERRLNFFSPLSVRYKLAYSSNYSTILDPVVENNYQLFMIERLILARAKTYIKTYKESETDLSLTDDRKKNTKIVLKLTAHREAAFGWSSPHAGNQVEHVGFSSYTF
ncbi:hypothetical protein CTI12_AA207490 [Artemisia annua]|uniref:O-fucosyltransferase family protein n=1 Tax=Artemisia annua TaxID=35608 RepID=A0A2U1P0C1_ARTAN|nr:hypothetical protein CTI12_AA207490 [Artemisia annua]